MPRKYSAQPAPRDRSDFTAFSTDSPAVDAGGGKGRSARSARARGLRTLQHQSLPAGTRFAIDTEVWLRTLVLEGWPEGEPAPPPRWATKDHVHDEALAWFLGQCAGRTLAPAARPDEPFEDLTFWLDSRLLERARLLARRSGMRLAHLIEMALSAYVATHVPEELMRFRRRVQLDAQRMYQRRAAPPPARSGAPAPPRSGSRPRAASRAR